MAIEAKELRIGNWVQGPLGEFVQVSQVGHKDNPNYIRCTNEEFDGQNGFEGIPLSPEILKKKLGFIEIDGIKGEYFFRLYSLRKQTKKGKYNNYGLFIHNFDRFVFLANIAFVHQLQNIIHSLTGEELKIDSL